MRRAPTLAVLPVLVLSCLGSHLARGGGDLVDRQVIAGGVLLRARVLGEGGPAVVFESAGGGATLESWEDVASMVARTTRVVIYDRAGIGGSSPGPSPRTAECTARELRELLRRLGVPPPYLLVGHSLGGLYIRFFASLYPEDVAGFVFLDPTTEEMRPRLDTEAARRHFERQLEQLEPGPRAEMAALAENVEALGKLGEPPDRSAVVITSMGPSEIPEGQRAALAAAGITPGKLREMKERVRAQHARLAVRFPRGKQVIARESGHNVQEDEPFLVRDEILGVLAEIRGATSPER